MFERVNPQHDFSRYMNAGSTDPRRDSAIRVQALMALAASGVT